MAVGASAPTPAVRYVWGAPFAALYRFLRATLTGERSTYLLCATAGSETGINLNPKKALTHLELRGNVSVCLNPP